MKRLALICIAISLLTGCATQGEHHPMENGDFYVGAGMSAQERLHMGNSVRSIRDAQIAGSGNSVRDAGGAYSQAGGLFHLFLGYRVAKALDLEATVFTNDTSAHEFSSGYSLYDQSIDHPSLSDLHSAKINGRLLESGAMLTALANWEPHEYLQLFARWGASYSQTNLKSRLERDLGPDKFISQVEYRTKDVRPVWGIGFTLYDTLNIEYLKRKIPIGSTASELSTASHESFDTPKIGGSETFHSLMITVRFGLKNHFGDGK